MSLIIDDEYYRIYAEFLEEQMNDISNAVSTYRNILVNVKDNGIIKGDTANALETFIGHCSSSVGGNRDIRQEGEATRRLVTEFLNDIDKADKDLY